MVRILCRICGHGNQWIDWFGNRESGKNKTIIYVGYQGEISRIFLANILDYDFIYNLVHLKQSN